MELDEFRTLVRNLASDIPDRYFDGIAAVDVSDRTVPHPTRAQVFTLGECIPFDTGTDEVVSRLVLYFGSFRALAANQEAFDWAYEARETLFHELRHHLEWRAGSDELEAYDWAVEQNILRIDGEAFEDAFYREGEVLEDGVFRVEDWYFIERVVDRAPATTELAWRGRRYRIAVPGTALPLFLTIGGLDEPLSGDVCLVFRRKTRLGDLVAGRPAISEAYADAERID